jgi:predicted RNase H-like HicB family nuclease
VPLRDLQSPIRISGALQNQRLAKAVCSELVNGMARPEIEFEQENDGRWIAEITALPSLMCYGKSQEEARRKVEALALRLFADRLEKMRIYPRSEDSVGKAV